MNVDQFSAALIYLWSECVQYKHIIMGVAITVTISYLKAARDKQPQNWGENLLCGIFAGIACSGLSVVSYFLSLILNIPSSLEIPTILVIGIVSGVIGMLGSHTVVDKIKSKFGKQEEQLDEDDRTGL